MNKRRPTIREIAGRAGVSAATVSYALRDAGTLTDETRRRVLEVAAAMGYPLDERAAKAQPEALSIGVIYPNELKDESLASHELFSQYARGIRRVTGEIAGCVLTYAPNVPAGFAFQHLLAEDVDGMIFFGTDQAHPAVQAALENDVPVVLINHHAQAGASSVCAANRQAMSGLVRHLVERHGCRRFAFMQPEGAATYSQERLAGCREGLRRAGLDPDALHLIRFAPGPGLAEACAELARRAGELDALLVDRDFFALMVAGELRAHGVEAPRDLCLTGFDDLAAARDATPALTTVRFDSEALGAQAAQQLVALIRGEIAEVHLQIGCDMMLRASCGCEEPQPGPEGGGRREA